MAERDGDPISVLLLTGGVATGKTTIAAEIGEVLAGAGRSIVIVDLDHLGWGFIPDSPEELIEKLRRTTSERSGRISTRRDSSRS